MLFYSIGEVSLLQFLIAVLLKPFTQNIIKQNYDHWFSLLFLIAETVRVGVKGTSWQKEKNFSQTALEQTNKTKHNHPPKKTHPIHAVSWSTYCQFIVLDQVEWSNKEMMKKEKHKNKNKKKSTNHTHKNPKMKHTHTNINTHPNKSKANLLRKHPIFLQIVRTESSLLLLEAI